MAIRRKIDASVIAELTAATKEQTISSGFSKTLDDKFPVFSTQIDKSFIIYIPKGPTCKVVDGESVFDPAVAFIHNARGNNTYTTFRCMKNIPPEIGAKLGYVDGECPVCNALSECYDKYNTQLNMRAAEMGLDPKDEKNNDALKPIREALRNEMAINKPVKKYIIPIVEITDADVIPQTVDAAALKPYFFPISESAFEKKLMKPLLEQLTPITNPAGMFFKLSYKYKPANGGKPNARDAAREMTITPILGADALVGKFVEPCEEVSKEFTAIQANTVVTEIAYRYCEDEIKEVDQLMSATRAFNASVAATGGAAPAIGTTAPAGNSLGNALGAFGVQGALPTGAEVPTGATTAPAGFGTPAAATAAPVGVAGFGVPTTPIDVGSGDLNG